MSTQGVPVAIVSQILGDEWPNRPNIPAIQKRLFERYAIEVDTDQVSRAVRQVRVRMATQEALRMQSDDNKTADVLTRMVSLRLGEPIAINTVEKYLRLLEERKQARRRQLRLSKGVFTIWERVTKPAAKPELAEPTS